MPRRGPEWSRKKWLEITRPKSDIYNFTPDIWVLDQLSSTIFINIYILCPTKGNSKIFIYFRIVFFRSGLGPCLVFFLSPAPDLLVISHTPCSDWLRSGMIGSMIGWLNAGTMRQMHKQWLQSGDSCSDWFCSGVIGSGIGWLTSGTMRQVHLWPISVATVSLFLSWLVLFRNDWFCDWMTEFWDDEAGGVYQSVAAELGLLLR